MYSPTAMRIGPFELILILAVVLIVFGAGRLPEIGAALPRAWKDFRRGTTGELDEDLPADTPATAARRRESQPAVAARQPTRRSRHPFRGVGLVLIGVGLILFYLDSEVFHLGLPLQIASGVAALLGALLFFL